MLSAPYHLSKILFTWIGFALLTSGGVHAGWREDCGWDLLAAYCDGLPMPAGEGVVVAQIEALSSGKYLPHSPGSGHGAEFSGKLFVDESGVATVSSHAANVGKYFYGNQSSVAGGLGDVRCWASLDLYRTVLNVPGAPVDPVPVDIMSAAFANVGTYSLELRALDHAVNESGFLPIASTLNGSANNLPEALVCAYNVLSVGLSSGNHASGPSPATVDGPGRVKPELVLPVTATSWATGAASSIAAVLCSAAPPEARRPEILKAIMLAGATKEKFPSWDKTVTRPLDEVFGAGEANLYNSFRILEGGETEPGTAGTRGWKFVAHDGEGETQWVFTVPTGFTGAKLSFMATWNRSLEYDSAAGIYEPEPLADVNLSLAGPSAPILQESRSTVDNVEHLYLPELEAGVYVVSLSSDVPVEVAVAWRLELEHRPVLTAMSQPGDALGMAGLYPGAEYTVQRTTDLQSWEDVASVVATGDAMDWIDPAPPGGPMVFYRLQYWAP